MKKFLLFSLMGVLMCCNYVTAQTEDSNLEIEVRKTIKQQCIHKIKALTDHFAIIAKKDEADSIKEFHIEACLDLFVGRGNGKKDSVGNVIFPVPRIEVSSRFTGRVNSYFIKSYLERLKRQSNTKIVFKTSDCYVVGENVKKIGDNLYSTTISFYQVFIGNNGDMVVTRNENKKTVEVIIERDNLGKFEILLGDIKVDETTKTDQL